jgi:hypothetical protein
MARDHYVSQFYLKRFGIQSENNSDTYLVHTFFRKSRNIELVWTKNIALRKDLFDPQIEHWFSQFEGYFNSLLEKIETNVLSLRQVWRPSIPITYDDKYLLARFVEFQFRRSMAVHPSMEISIKKANEDIINFIRGYKDLDFSVDDLSDKLNKEMYPTAVNTFARRFFDGDEEIGTPKILDVLLRRDWYLLYINSSKPCQFITCDFPLSVFNPNWNTGIIDNETELAFPLSKDILLVNAWIEHGGAVKYVPVKDRSVTRVANKMTASNAIDMLFWENRSLLKSVWDYWLSDNKKFKKWVSHNTEIPMEDIKKDIDIFLTAKSNKSM